MPLLPWVFVQQESQLDLATIGAYIVHLQRCMDSEAAPIAWIDDCTERSFNQSTRALEHILRKDVLEGTLKVSREAHTVKGLFWP